VKVQVLFKMKGTMTHVLLHTDGGSRSIETAIPTRILVRRRDERRH